MKPFKIIRFVSKFANYYSPINKLDQFIEQLIWKTLFFTVYSLFIFTLIFVLKHF